MTRVCVPSHPRTFGEYPKPRTSDYRVWRNQSKGLLKVSEGTELVGTRNLPVQPKVITEYRRKTFLVRPSNYLILEQAMYRLIRVVPYPSSPVHFSGPVRFVWVVPREWGTIRVFRSCPSVLMNLSAVTDTPYMSLLVVLVVGGCGCP